MDNLTLRKLKPEDAAPMLEWMHDRNVVQYMEANFMEKTMSDCEAFIRKSENDEKNMHLAVVDKDDRYLGTVSLKNINMQQRCAEFAITISRLAMGKGVSKYAMEEIIRIAFEELELNSVYWYVSPDNKRAIRFYDKNGYQRIPEILAEGEKEKNKSYIWYQVNRKHSDMGTL